MNERKATRRPWPAQRTGWLCAGVSAMAVVLCVCVPDLYVRVAGADENADVQRFDAEDADSDQFNVDEGDAESELEPIRRAHLRVDSQAPKKSEIKQVSLWPFTKPPADSSSVAKLRQSQYGKWNQKSPRDPFAEAENQTPALKSSATVNRSTIGSDATISENANYASNRRRLLKYQSANDAPSEETAEETTESLAAGFEDEATPVAILPRATVPASSQSQPETETDLRALFEQSMPDGETASAAEAGSELAKSVESKLPSDEIRQASRNVESPAEAAASDSQDTSILLEALQLRSRQSQRRRHAESARQLRLATDESGSAERTQQESSQMRSAPALSAISSKGLEDEASAAVTTAIPSPRPRLDHEIAGRARVDQVTDDVEASAASTKEGTGRLDPAITSIPTTVSERKGRRLVPATGTTEMELEIRPARKAGLPEPQVLANRPLELPAPEGWSAATKLESARRARQSKTSTVISRAHANTASNDSVLPSPSIRLMANRGGKLPQPETPPAQEGIKQVQPVNLDAIEDDELRPLVNAEFNTDVISNGDLQSADYQDESVQREPAKIAESNAEPIIVPHLAAEGRPPWVMYAIAVGGVLFGLYGLWRAGATHRR